MQAPAVMHRHAGHASTSYQRPTIHQRPAVSVARGRTRRVVVVASTAPAPAYVTSPVPSLSRELEAIQLPLPPQESPADDPALHNPLERQKRLSTGWFGALVEYEGCLVEDTHQQHIDAWLKTAADFGYPRPLGHLFRRIRGVRDEVCVSRVFGWSQNPTTIKALTEAKAKTYDELMGGRQPAELLETRGLLDMLSRNSVPVALVCPLPERKVKESLKQLNLAGSFSSVVTAEDSGAPEVEYSYMIAGQQLQRPPTRCVVIGSSNVSVEAAHELGMKAVVVTGSKPVYDFVGADLVVRHLGQVTFLNLKKLFSEEQLVKGRMQQEAEEAAAAAAAAGDMSDDGSAFDDEDEDMGRGRGRGYSGGSSSAAGSSYSAYAPFDDGDGDFDDEDDDNSFAAQYLRGSTLGGSSSLRYRP